MMELKIMNGFLYLFGTKKYWKRTLKKAEDKITLLEINNLLDFFIKEKLIKSKKTIFGDRIFFEDKFIAIKDNKIEHNEMVRLNDRAYKIFGIERAKELNVIFTIAEGSES